jgi:hypothetical protein
VNFPSLSARKLVTATLGLAGAAAASFLFIEPMRWNLPLRYLVQPLDIYREGFVDYRMCLRVALSQEETDAFLRKMFETGRGTERVVPQYEMKCPASFWPESFQTATVAYSAEVMDNGSIDGSSGAIYENGILYFWSNDE